MFLFDVLHQMEKGRSTSLAIKGEKLMFHLTKYLKCGKMMGGVFPEWYHYGVYFENNTNTFCIKYNVHKLDYKCTFWFFNEYR